MHIEKTSDGFNLTGEWFRIPLDATTEAEALRTANELLASDWFRDRVHLPDCGARALEVRTDLIRALRKLDRIIESPETPAEDLAGLREVAEKCRHQRTHFGTHRKQSATESQ